MKRLSSGFLKVYRPFALALSVSLLAISPVNAEVLSSSKLAKEEQAFNKHAISLISKPQQGFLTCVECHGILGRSKQSALSQKQVPKLAGQDMGYLYDQLINFKLGRRYTTEMSGILASYSDQELQTIAHYYAGQPLLTPPNLDVTQDALKHTQLEDDTWAKLGESLYLKGDEMRGIQACQTCHGVYGEGRIIGLDKAPKLTGQHARYVRMTLENFAKGKRTTDGLFDQPMQTISRKLNDKDRRNLAAYIQRLSLPKQ